MTETQTPAEMEMELVAENSARLRGTHTDDSAAAPEAQAVPSEETSQQTTEAAEATETTQEPTETAPAETTEAAATEEPPVEDGSFMFGSEDTQAPSSTETPAQDQVVNDPLYNEFKEDYLALREDPEFKLFVELKKNGKSLSDVASQVSVVDFSQMNGEQLLEHAAQQDDWTQDELDKAVEEYNDSSRLNKQRLERDLRSEFETAQSDRMKQFTSGDPEEQARMELIQEKAAQDLEKAAEEMKGGKSFLGYQFKEDDPRSFLDFAENFDQEYMNKDGTVNVAVLRQFWFAKNKLRTLHSLLTQKATEDGKLTILQELQRASASGAVTTQQAAPTEKKSPQEQSESIVNWASDDGKMMSSPKPR